MCMRYFKLLESSAKAYFGFKSKAMPRDITTNWMEDLVSARVLGIFITSLSSAASISALAAPVRSKFPAPLSGVNILFLRGERTLLAPLLVGGGMSFFGVCGGN